MPTMTCNPSGPIGRRIKKSRFGAMPGFTSGKLQILNNLGVVEAAGVVLFHTLSIL